MEGEDLALFDFIPRQLIAASRLVAAPWSESPSAAAEDTSSVVAQICGTAAGRLISDSSEGQQAIDNSTLAIYSNLAEPSIRPSLPSTDTPSTSSQTPLEVISLRVDSFISAPELTLSKAAASAVLSSGGDGARVVIREISLGGATGFRLTVDQEYRGSYPSRKAAELAAETFLAGHKGCAQSTSQESLAIAEHIIVDSANTTSRGGIGGSGERLEVGDAGSLERIRAEGSEADVSEVEFVAHSKPRSIEATSSSEPGKRRRRNGPSSCKVAPRRDTDAEGQEDCTATRCKLKARGRQKKQSKRIGAKGSHDTNGSTSPFEERRRELKRRRIEVEREVLRKELEILMLDLK